MPRTGRIHWLAVLAGYLLDVLLSFVLPNVGAALLTLFGVAVDPAALTDGFLGSPTGLLFGVSLTLATLIGGWLAGRLAKEERFLHGVLVAVIGLALSLLAAWGGATPRLDEVVRLCLTLPLAGLAGRASGWSAARQ